MLTAEWHAGETEARRYQYSVPVAGEGTCLAAFHYCIPTGLSRDLSCDISAFSLKNMLHFLCSRHFRDTPCEYVILALCCFRIHTQNFTIGISNSLRLNFNVKNELSKGNYNDEDVYCCVKVTS